MSLLCYKPFVQRKCQHSQAGWHSSFHRRDAAHRCSGLSSSVAKPPQGCSVTKPLPVAGTRYNRCANPQTPQPDGWFSAARSRPDGCCRWPKQPPPPPDNVLLSVTSAVADHKQPSECLSWICTMILQTQLSIIHYFSVAKIRLFSIGCIYYLWKIFKQDIIGNY